MKKIILQKIKTKNDKKDEVQNKDPKNEVTDNSKTNEK